MLNTGFARAVKGSSLSTDQLSQTVNFLEFSDIFANSKADLSNTKSIMHKIDAGDSSDSDAIKKCGPDFRNVRTENTLNERIMSNLSLALNAPNFIGCQSETELLPIQAEPNQSHSTDEWDENEILSDTETISFFDDDNHDLISLFDEPIPTSDKGHLNNLTWILKEKVSPDEDIESFKQSDVFTAQSKIDNYMLYVNFNTKKSIDLVKDKRILDPKLKRPFQFGWKREIVWRRTCHPKNRKKKADVYYCSPSGVKCRSLKEISHFLSDELQKYNFSFRPELIGMPEELELMRVAKAKKRTKTNYGTKKMSKKTFSKTASLQNPFGTHRTIGFGTYDRKKKFAANKEIDEITASKTVADQSSAVVPEKNSFGMLLRSGKRLKPVVSDEPNPDLTKEETINMSDDKFKKPFIYGWTRELVNDRVGSANGPDQSSDKTTRLSGILLRSGKRLAEVISDKPSTHLTEKETAGWTQRVYYIGPSGKKFRSLKAIANYIIDDDNLTSENFTFIPLPIGISGNDDNIIKNAAPPY